MYDGLEIMKEADRLHITVIRHQENALVSPLIKRQARLQNIVKITRHPRGILILQVLVNMEGTTFQKTPQIDHARSKISLNNGD